MTRLRILKIFGRGHGSWYEMICVRLVASMRQYGIRTVVLRVTLLYLMKRYAILGI